MEIFDIIPWPSKMCNHEIWLLIYDEEGSLVDEIEGRVPEEVALDLLMQTRGNFMDQHD